MNVQQKGVITLIKSALNNKCYELPNAFALEGVIEIAREHQISPIVYYGAINCGYDKACDVMQKLFEKALPLVLFDEMQNAALSEISREFEKGGIEYMPLKGSVLKSLYPKTEMRTMGDVDILIKTEQYESVKKVMSDLGFDKKVESDHEFVWLKDNLCIELHKRLIPSYNKDFYAYFGEGWQLAKQCTDFRYTMDDEAFFIHLITHFAKHYRDGGIGIKHLVDIWVYKTAKPELDFEYIKNELLKLRLDKFFEYVEKTLENWFENGEETPETEFISDTVFRSGVYGNKETAEVSTMLRETKDGKSVAGTKFSRFFGVVFLPYGKMCEKYKVLRKLPFLLLFMWIVRLFDILLFKRKKMSAYIEKQKSITKDTVKSRKKELNSVGLDFYTEEDVK